MTFDYRSAERLGNQFGANVRIEHGASIGGNNLFEDHCVIRRNVVVGSENTFGAGVVVGGPSRQRVQGSTNPVGLSESGRVVVGDGNFFEEYVTVHSPLWFETTIGSNVALGAYTHIAHDCRVGDEVFAAAHCAVGGWCSIGRGAYLGLHTSVHQRTAIGAWALTGAGAVVIRSVAPSAVVIGIPAEFLRINLLGLQRAGFNQREIEAIEATIVHGQLDLTLPDAARREIRAFRQDTIRWGRSRSPIPRAPWGE